jgi:hypothetical protein
MDNSEAYFTLTRKLLNLHHTERTALDNSPQYQAIMDLVKEGTRESRANAILLAQGVRTERGGFYRAERNLPFVQEEVL